VSERGHGAATATRWLFAVAALLWVGVAVLIGAGWVSLGEEGAPARAPLAVLMLTAGAALALLGRYVLRGRRWVDALAVIAAVTNVVAAISDDLGVWDAAYLAFSLVLLGVLVWALARTGSRRAP
jgi:hypothetical protein